MIVKKKGLYFGLIVVLFGGNVTQAATATIVNRTTDDIWIVRIWGGGHPRCANESDYMNPIRIPVSDSVKIQISTRMCLVETLLVLIEKGRKKKEITSYSLDSNLAETDPTFIVTRRGDGCKITPA